MTPGDLESLLHSARLTDPARTAQCPDDHELAAYADGFIAEDRRATFEGHLSDCDYCLTVVGVLSHAREGAKPAQLQEPPINARARRPSPAATVRGVPQWAVAAGALLALGALVRLSTVNGPMGDSVPTSEERITRSADFRPPLTLLSPRPGEAVNQAQLLVRWTPVDGSKFYDVRVVTESGDVVVEQHVRGTEWRPTGVTGLQPGGEYFVHVDAYITDDKSVSSEHVAFSVSK